MNKIKYGNLGTRNTIEFDGNNHSIIFAIQKDDKHVFVGETIGNGMAKLAIPTYISVDWLVNATSDAALVHLKETGLWEMNTPFGKRFGFSRTDVRAIHEFILKHKIIGGK